MESKVHQMNWFQSGKYSFYFWNQFIILVHSNLQKSTPGGDFAHVEYHCLERKITLFRCSL